MLRVTAPILNYSQLPSKHGRRSVCRWLAGTAAIALIVGVAYWAIDEAQLRREAAALAAANAPAQVWSPTAPIALRPDATLILPDGRIGRLIEMRPRRAARDAYDPDAELQSTLQKLRAERVGCTVVRTDASGTPHVQIWALAPRYIAMCGLSSSRERRRGRMRLWRNMGAYMVSYGNMDATEEGYKSSISVVGY